MMIGFSIIVCCYNSEQKISHALQHLKNLKTSPNFSFQIITVDNNSTDNTAIIIANFKNENPNIDLQIITENRVGKVNALESGIAKAKFEYIVICDDDNGLDENYLQIAYPIMESDKKIGILGARGFLHDELIKPTWFKEFENCYAVGSQSLYNGDVTKERGYVWGAGMIFRKLIWDQLYITGFDGFLTGRTTENVRMAGEDTEFCILGRMMGYSIFYDDRLSYIHYISQSRLNWNHLIQLWEGFSRSQVYFSMYELCFTNHSLNTPFPLTWFSLFKTEAKHFFHGFFTINWFKAIYIAFFENREGYLIGLEKRKYLFRMKELIRISFQFKTLTNRISKLNFND
jgi:glycosyltransferase involved in cell wall biosynthesis